MKKGILAFLILALTISCYAQQKNFGTKTIGQWTFEKFPLHYSVTPTKTMSYKNRITGKLEQYEELNQLGQTNGLKLTMSSDGINPSDAIYMYKGEMVYSVTFFPGSKIAQQISTYNEHGLLDGYEIYRTLKSTGGGYTEEIEKYVDDVLVEINGAKQAPFSITYKDSLLNGRFKFENSRSWVIEGIAEMGKLKKIKQTQEGKYFMCEITFQTDSIIVKEPYQSQEGFSIEKFPLVSNPTITNSKSLCLKYGNYNGFPYFIMPNDFDIRDLKEITKQIFAEPLETKVNYVDSLLDGDFQFREYIYRGSYYYEGIVSVTGKAEKGKLKFLRVRTIEFDSYSGVKSTDKAFEYQFQENKILQNEFVPELPNEPVSTKTLDLLYPVLLTNSVHLGGAYSYAYDNTNNPLGVPIKRKSKLENNNYGYVYFSPTTFDVSNLISIVTTKTEKPFVQKTPFNNGFLDGDFDFKEDRIQFTGKANSGIIETMKIKCDFETSKQIWAQGTSMNGQWIHYDVVLYSLNGESYNITYMNSAKNEKIYEETISFSKNKKVTTSENLAAYENFVYCSTYQDLRNTFYDMKFFVKK